MEDGPLFALVQQEFDVLVAIDRGLEFHQNLARLRMGVVIVHVPKNGPPIGPPVRGPPVRPSVRYP